MYRPKAYVRDDVRPLHDFIRTRSFATIAASIAGEIHFAYAPVVLDPQLGPHGGVRFHLARANPLAAMNGTVVKLSILGPDTYISPDWYAADGFVPTWNYIAVEGTGRAQPLAEADLRRLLVDLSAQHEEKLRPKTPWTLDKISESRLSGLLNAIVGFSVTFDSLHGKFKLSQDKPQSNVAAVISHLETRDDPGARAIADAMRLHAPSGR